MTYTLSWINNRPTMRPSQRRADCGDRRYFTDSTADKNGVFFTAWVQHDHGEGLDVDLGTFESRDDAKAACDKHNRRRRFERELDERKHTVGEPGSCQYCDGDGIVTDDGPHHDCNNCNGTGRSHSHTLARSNR